MQEDNNNKLEAADAITTTETVEAVPSIEDLQKQVADYKLKTTIPETYDLTSIKTLNDQDADVFSNFAKKTSLTQTQAVEVATEYTSMMQEQVKGMETYKNQMKEDTLTTLKDVFGDSMEVKLSGAKNIVKEFGGDKLVEYLDTTGLGNNADLIQAFVKISDSLGEDSNASKSIEKTAASTSKSPSDARKELRELFSTKEGRRTVSNPLDPNSNQQTKELMELAKLASQKD